MQQTTSPQRVAFVTGGAMGIGATSASGWPRPG
jgi:NAD(P)-dependent dehydrogenase (short-subunit alcohol dehydrogenase family)